jgi:hypothetical protein
MQPATNETSSKARKRNKNNKSTHTSTATDKNPVATRAPTLTHPKSATKDDVLPSKVQGKAQMKSSQVSNKSTVSTVASAPSSTTAIATTKKSMPSITTNQTITEQSIEQEQPFTIVGGNRNKNGSSTSTIQQQQIKTVSQSTE